MRLGFLALFCPLFSFADDCSKAFKAKQWKAKQALIIGSGPFGFSFAQVISHNFEKVTVFGRNKKTDRQMKKKQKVNHLPGVRLYKNIKMTLDLEPFLNKPLDMLVLALPVSEMAPFAKTHSSTLLELFKNNEDLPVLSLSKGFYFKKGNILFIEEFLLNKWPGLKRDNFYLVSGPSFAMEMAQGEKTVVNLAGYNKKRLRKIRQLISTQNFNVLLSRDMKAVAFGGAVKNVMSIADGLSKGLGIGHNTRSALIVRGTKDLIKIGIKLGSDPSVFLGPSYLGDLILSLERESRNSRLGFALGKGQSFKDFLKENPKINTEGANTIKELYKYAKGKKGFRFIKFLYRIVYEGESPELLLRALD